MRHVPEGIEIRVVCRNFNAAAPSIATIKIQAAGVRDRGPINHELVVMEPFVLGTRHADPGAVFALGQGVLGAAQKLEHDTLSLWRNHTDPDAPFRIDLGVLLARLV
jgi:hypothetical protein